MTVYSQSLSHHNFKAVFVNSLTYQKLQGPFVLFQIASKIKINIHFQKAVSTAISFHTSDSLERLKNIKGNGINLIPEMCLPYISHKIISFGNTVFVLDSLKPNVAQTPAKETMNNGGN